ncbi:MULTISPECIES: 5-oxoprolinase subunit PxpB [Sporosarcina]|uniref:5-oxoprolinase subunit PxpB n=1 Tax=Sporosarcina TaxID=1569 RepID=UPI000590E362|nr:MULTISPECIES: 5-oxoprolinase subunit PxpB [Sporosarcina]WJY26882.1 5-oxoprolinase subunit PxpB [Sporosarcina sp. 0.2-SM1T-5]
MECTIHPLGDQAVICRLGDADADDTELKIRSVTAALTDRPPVWLTEYVSSYTSVTVYYDIRNCPAGKSPYDHVSQQLATLIGSLDPATQIPRRTVRLPVLYGGMEGPDLLYVASIAGMTPDEVVRQHAAGRYIVRMIGFSPGFPFLSGLPAALSMPRKQTPRLSIPERSVGIAGRQTGVYPISTPGGWQLIGRTPVDLFMPDREPPSLLEPGDLLEFCPITQQQYDEIREETSCLNYSGPD